MILLRINILSKIITKHHIQNSQLNLTIAKYNLLASLLNSSEVITKHHI